VPAKVQRKNKNNQQKPKKVLINNVFGFALPVFLFIFAEK